MNIKYLRSYNIWQSPAKYATWKNKSKEIFVISVSVISGCFVKQTTTTSISRRADWMRAAIWGKLCFLHPYSARFNFPFVTQKYSTALWQIRGPKILEKGWNRLAGELARLFYYYYYYYLMVEIYRAMVPLELCLLSPERRRKLR